jgi:hypothetical protein
MNKKIEKYYAVFKDEDDVMELWSGACSSKEAAMSAGEMKILDTYGSKSRKYMKRVNELFAVNSSEARYMKVI